MPSLFSVCVRRDKHSAPKPWLVTEIHARDAVRRRGTLKPFPADVDRNDGERSWKLTNGSGRQRKSCSGTARASRNFHGLDISDEGENSGSFRDALLDGADFSHSFVLADFSCARLRNSKFVEANVKTCTFDRADLLNADFSEAAICGATFSNCNFEGAEFEGAHWYGITFKKGELPPDDL
jgi:uncharacterized protein YjbI with pentapeptide repeats